MIKCCMKKIKAQNLIEFALVLPLIVVMFFGIIELSLFWKTINNVQSIALQAASAASGTFVAENQTGSVVSNTNFNAAVSKAASIVVARSKSLNIDSLAFNSLTAFNGGQFGDRPYSMYVLESTQTKKIDGVDKPVLTLTVDYRDPYKQGVVVQLSYYYSTVLLGAEFTMPGGKKVTIIPKNIAVSSTKIQQYINY